MIYYRFKAVLCAMMVLLLTGTAAFGQTFSEWFSQKKTQIKYLNQQITALVQYGSYLKQGYQISQHGLSGIGTWVKGEFDFHSDYYTSLKQVNPVISGSSRADSIISYTGQISVRFDNLLNLGTLDPGARIYIGKVRSTVINHAEQDLSELQTIMAGGLVQMSDDERLSRLEEIYNRVKDNYAFTLFFCEQVRASLLQRYQESRDVNTLKQYYGITN